MNVTKIRLQGLTVIELPIVGAQPTDRYICKGVDGLGPPEIDVRVKNGLNSKGVFQNKKTLPRELVIAVGLNPDYAAGERPSDLRGELYGLLTTGKQYEPDGVSIEVWVEGREDPLYTSGWVSRMETPIFSKDPMVQITIQCKDVYLEGNFVELPVPANKAFWEIVNTGSAPTGILFMFTYTGAASSFSLGHANYMPFEVVYNFQANDVIYYLSDPGGHTLYRMRAGQQLQMAGMLGPSSDWVMLHGGLNQLQFNSTSWTLDTLGYREKFWGI